MATLYASSLAQSDVQAIINSAAAGDTVILPAGSATWSTAGNGVTINAIDGITIQGAGIDQTIITDELGHANDFTAVFLFQNYHVAGKSFRITGMTIITDPTNYSSSTISLSCPQNFRIDHIKITQIVRRGIFVVGAQGNVDIPRGLIDHCELYAPYDLSAQLITVQANDFSFPPTVASPTNGSWETVDGPGFGTANSVFVEDCILSMDFPNDASIETYSGGRCVVRYCVLTNFVIGAHGHDTSTRSGHCIEVYENTIVNTLGNAAPKTINLRGGTAVMWNNAITWSGTGFANTFPIQLQVYRGVGTALQPLTVSGVPAPYTAYNGSYTYNAANQRYERNGDTSKYLYYDSGTGFYSLFGDGAVQYQHSSTNPNTVVGSYTAVGDIVDANGATVSSFYVNNFLNGSEPTDGNTAVTNGSGTHTGSNGAASLTDSTKSWTSNEMLGFGTAAFDDELFAYYIWNRTTGAGGFVTANSATGVTAALSGGTRQTWNTGDEYVITNGYPGLDQVGRAGPTIFNDTYSVQTLSPIYVWNNTFNGAADTRPFLVSWLGEYDARSAPRISEFVQENREYYNNTAKPGYTPYTYPHPRGGPFYRTRRLGRHLKLKGLSSN